MRDKIVDNQVRHEVKKIWKGIVSCGSYTLDKCLDGKMGLTLIYGEEEMAILYEDLKARAFQLHKKVVPSKWGQDYTMYDFKWEPTGLIQKQHELFNG